MHTDATDWAFCRASLVDVSRTFSIPIRMLRPPLERAVTCGYLLCRIVDTFEDETSLDLDAVDAAYAAFLRALTTGRAEDASVVEQLARALPGDGADVALARQAGRVFAVVSALEPAQRRILVHWVAEMARGMAIYSHRRAAAGGLDALTTLPDLERYCYFVAGTVGHMLTELFQDALGPAVTADRRAALLARAEAFGRGLQLVNILKDVADDHARGVSFVPREACDAAGLASRDLGDPEYAARAHAALAPLRQLARTSLEDALDYCLALPATALDIRLFCLVPLWLAARTLALAEAPGAGFAGGQPVRLTRDDVVALVADCRDRASAADPDHALRVGWRALTHATAAGAPTLAAEAA